MILVIGLTSDPVLRYMVEALTQRDLYIVFIDQQRLGHTLHIDDEGITCSRHQWRIAHHDVEGVINRMVGMPDPKSHRSSSHMLHIEWLSFLLDTTYPKVLNRPNPGLSNGSKPYQLTDLPCQTLQRPESVVVTNMAAPDNTEMIFKSISSTRSIVQAHRNTGAYTYEPVLFQQCCQGQNIRVHTIDKTLVAIAITSDTLDYRYNKQANRMSHITLPKTIADECRHISQYLELPFSGIDLIREQDRWTLLEINPAPGYQYFEQHLNHTPITDAIGDYFSHQL